MKRVAVVVVLWAGGCERSKPVENAPAPALVTPAIPAPTPPRPGTVDLEVTGTVALTKRGTGTMCGVSKRIASTEFQGPGDEPAWEFWVNERARDATLANADLTLGETLYEWVGPGAPFLPHDGPQALRFDHELTGPAGAKVRVRAHLTCPSFPTAPVPAQVAALLTTHTGRPPRAYSTFDFGRAQYPAAASVTLPEAQARAALPTLRAALPPGYVAHRGTSRFLDDAPAPAGDVELVLAPGADQFHILRTARTDRINHGIRTEAIVQQLTRWDRTHGIDIVLANTDTVVFTLRRARPEGSTRLHGAQPRSARAGRRHAFLKR